MPLFKCQIPSFFILHVRLNPQSSILNPRGVAPPPPPPPLTVNNLRRVIDPIHQSPLHFTSLHFRLSPHSPLPHLNLNHPLGSARDENATSVCEVNEGGWLNLQ
jgi:hypothetical protein